MPTAAEPFAVALGLMIATIVVYSRSLPKLDGKIVGLGIDSNTKGQLLRSANWFSDSTQALAILTPPVVGLAVGAASGSTTLIYLYWAVIVVTFVALLFFGFSNPLDYGYRLNPRFPITVLGFFGLIVNAIALAVAWLVPVSSHPTG